MKTKNKNKVSERKEMKAFVLPRTALNEDYNLKSIDTGLWNNDEELCEDAKTFIRKSQELGAVIGMREVAFMLNLRTFCSVDFKSFKREDQFCMFITDKY